MWTEKVCIMFIYNKDSLLAKVKKTSRPPVYSVINSVGIMFKTF